MSNYPPGVTGGEPEIAGYPACSNAGCGHPAEEHGNGEDTAVCQEPGCGCRDYYGVADDDGGYDNGAEA